MSNILELYKTYLVQKATQEGRPFRLPKNEDTLVNRKDYKLFLGLLKLLNDSKLEVKSYRHFMQSAREHLQGEFYISSILEYYPVIYKEFSEKKSDQLWIPLLKEIKNSFEKLEEYVIINNIRSLDEMNIGNPPTVLKMWKEGVIKDIVVVYILNLEMLKRKSWFKVYCAGLYQNINKLKSMITYNSEIKECLIIETEKLNDIMKAFVK